MSSTSTEQGQLSDPEIRLLQAILDGFASSGEWPLVDQLQHELDKSGDELDVAAVGAQIDRVLGHIDGVTYQGRASLTIHGIALCSGGEAVLADLLCLIRLAYSRYIADGVSAHVTSEELMDTCGMDDRRLRRTFALIGHVSGIGGGSGSPDGRWAREVRREIRRFKNVQTIAELLEAVPLLGSSNTLPASASTPTEVKPLPVARPLIPAQVLSGFKECFVSREVIRSIDEFFGDLDFQYAKDAYDRERAASHGERRSTAAGYLATLDLTDPMDAERLLKAMASKLRDWESRTDPSYRTDLDRLIRTLDSGGFSWNGKSIVRRAGALIIDAGGRRLRALGFEDVTQEIERIAAAIDSDPADAITAARALLEAVCKAVMEELGAPIVEADDLPILYKKTAGVLKLDPVQHDVVYRQTLQGMVSVVQGLAELRNKLGDAHGKSRKAVRPAPRHARLAASSASAVATFLVETLEERRAGRLPS